MSYGVTLTSTPSWNESYRSFLGAFSISLGDNSSCNTRLQSWLPSPWRSGSCRNCFVHGSEIISRF